MKGDFSRQIFDRRNHYAGVLHQQGRVWLDSDWNEGVLERLDLDQQTTLDVVGECGVPAPGTAFQITANPDPNRFDDFVIGGGPGAAGRAYVAGILCRIESPTTYRLQPDLPDPPPIPLVHGIDNYGIIYLEVWRRLITSLEDPSIAEVALGGPDTATRLKTISQVKALLVPGPTPCHALASVLSPGDGTLTTIPQPQAQPDDLCNLPDPTNYTGRANHFYRVEIHNGGGSVDEAGSVSSLLTKTLEVSAQVGDTALHLAEMLSLEESSAIERWANVVTLIDPVGRVEHVEIAAASSDRTSLALVDPLAQAFDKGNTLVVGLALFKWSRDNAARAENVTAVNPDNRTLTLSSLGRDQASTLRQGDLVELSDDASELGPARGHLTTLATDPDPDLLTVTLAEEIPERLRPASNGDQTTATRHLILRRWEGTGVVRSKFQVASTLDLSLDAGVQIQFAGRDLRPGDYWNFTARSVDGSVEQLTNAPPNGIRRYYCPLALVRWSPVPIGSPPASPPLFSDQFVMHIENDCRQIFSPLSLIPSAERAMHITGVYLRQGNPLGTLPLRNDQNVTATALASGVDVFCDHDVDSVSVSRPTVYVTVEIPFTRTDQQALSPAVAYQMLTLVGTLTITANIISWQPAAATSRILGQIAALRGQAERGVLCRLVLRGNFIWSVGPPWLHLDGSSYGLPDYGFTTPDAIRLAFPTGDRRRTGDFETWFWLIPDAGPG